MRPVDKIITNLESSGSRPVKQGRGYSAHCPAHEDGHPSLTVTEASDGKVLLHCHAGCNADDILSALGLEWSEFFPVDAIPSVRTPEWNPFKEGNEVAAYAYVDESSQPLFESVRFELQDPTHPAYPSKTFRIRGKGNGGSTVWNLGGARLVLYRLPMIIAAVKAGITIYIVEGEKDVHRLEAIGLVATCNPLGAGKWRPEYSKYLRGADVVVLSDNDEAGHKHAQDVATSLHGVAASVRLV